MSLIDRATGYLLNTFYVVAILVLLPWLLWSAVRKGKYRQGLVAKLVGRVPRRHGNGPCVWLHAVSVGEVNVLRPLITQLSEQHPDVQIIVSTTTKTGYALACLHFTEHTVIYCPLDFTWAVRTAMRRVRPQLLVLTELELWPNLIAAAKHHGSAVAVINARLSEKSFRGYRRLGRFITRTLRQIDVIAAQDATTAERFRQLGAAENAVQVTGSMKYDGAETNRNNSATQQLRELAGITDDDTVFLAGSTQAPEEAMALRVFQQLASQFPSLRLILVPRHPERFDEVAKLLDASGGRWHRRTQLEPPHSEIRPVPFNCPRILLVDTIGELGAWWGTADIAYVGGSMGNRGGQNMIEPSAYGAAVSFGPNTKNFRDIVAALLCHNAATVVHDDRGLADFVRRCLADEVWRTQQGDRARTFVKSQQGATEQTLTFLLHQLSNESQSKSTKPTRLVA